MSELRFTTYNLRLAIALFFILPVLALATPLAAQTPTLESRATYAFGQMLRFELRGETVDPIQQVSLFFQAPELAATYTTTIEVVSDDVIQLTHEVDLTQIRLAPFTEVTYWWLLQTVEGTEIEMPRQTMLYEDDRFVWQTLSESRVTVHWTNEDVGLGRIALDIALDARENITTRLQGRLLDEMRPIDVYVYPSTADLRAALRLTGRDWVGAHASPELGVVLVTAVNRRTAATDLRQSIPHELWHVLLYRANVANYETVPLWLNEGLATLAEAAPNPIYDSVLTTAVRQDETIPLADLCLVFPSADSQALLAYAQSASVMQYIESQYGNQAIIRLLDAFADGADCQSGTVRAFDVSLADLDQNWQRYLQPRSPLEQFFSRNVLWLLLLAGSFGITILLIVNVNENNE